MPDDLPGLEPDPEHLPGLEPDPDETVDPSETEPVDTDHEPSPSHNVDPDGRWVYGDRIKAERYDSGVFKPDRESLIRWFNEQMKGDAFSRWFSTEYDRYLKEPEHYSDGELTRFYQEYVADMEPEAGRRRWISSDSPSPRPTGMPFFKKAGVAVVAIGVFAGGAFLLSKDRGEEEVTPVTQTTAAAVESVAPTEAPSATQPPAITEASAAADTAGEESTDTATALNTVPGATVKEVRYQNGSHIVTVVVAGDGRALASAPNTTYYNVLLAIATPDGDFQSRSSLRQGTLEWEVAGPNTRPIDGANLDAEWTDSSTYVIAITNPENDGSATAIQVDILVGVVDGDGGDVYYQHGLLWTP